MMSTERLGAVSREQLTTEQLAEFVAVCIDEFDGPNGSEPAIAQYLDAMHEYSWCRRDPHILSQLDYRNRPALESMARLLYPEVTSDDLHGLAQMDAATLGELSGTTFDPNDARKDTHWWMLEPYLFGSEHQLFGTAHLFRRGSASEALVSRQTSGAPRQLQLILATEAALQMGQTEDPEELIRRFKLSDNELLACYQLYATAKPWADWFTSLLLQNERLVRLIEQSDHAAPLIASRLEVGFNDPKAWPALSQFLTEAQLQEWLPDQRRRELTLASIGHNPRLPEDHLLPYVQPEEVAQAAYTKITGLLLASKKTHYWHTKVETAEELGIDSTAWRLEAIERTHAYISTLAAVAEPDSDMERAAAEWQRTIDTIDPELDVRLAECTDAYNSIKPWPIEGWSGGPEERQLVTELREERDAAIRRYEATKERLQSYIATMARSA